MLSSHNPPFTILLNNSCVSDLPKNFQMELSNHTQDTITTKKKSSIRKSFRSFIEKSFRSKLSLSLNKANSISRKNIVGVGSLVSYDQKQDSSQMAMTGRISGAISTTSNTIDYSSDCMSTDRRSIYTNWKFVTAIKTMDGVSMRCLNFVEGQNFFLLEEEDHDWLVVKDTQSNQVGRVPTQYFVPSYKYHQYSIWYHPNMTRNDTENLMKNETTPGIFLVRNGESCRDQLSLSVLNRFHDVKHYKIRVVNEHTNNQGFYIHQSKLFLNLVQLINHYSTYSDGICCRLSPLLTQSFIDARHVNISSRQQPKPHKDYIDPVENIKYQRFNPETFKCDDVVLKNKIGAGNFGDVWMGVVPTQQRLFAVKILSNTTTKSVKQFKNEINILSTLDHPKIIKYYTSVVDKDKARYWIVTNLMRGGNLVDFLRNQTNRAHIRFPELMNIVSQVCSGMLYLEDNSIIHRDLAARNILVGESWETIRISDFGMACTVESVMDMQRKALDHRMISSHPTAESVESSSDVNDSKHNSTPADDHSLFALKWMAPEAALHRQFSLKSDVWSFGILLYEIITYGQHPYVSMTNKETVERIANGYRLPQPAYCPNSIYNVMLSCVAVLISGSTQYGRRIVFRYPYDMFEDTLRNQNAHFASKYGQQFFESFRIRVDDKTGSGATNPQSPLESLDNRTLARVLEPLTTHTKTPFELHLDDIVFVGYPLKIQKDNESLITSKNLDEHSSGNVEIKKHSKSTFGMNVVFIMHHYPLNTTIKQFFTDLSKNFILSMQREECKCNYISMETRLLCQIFDNFEDQLIELCAYNSHFLGDEALTLLVNDIKHLIKRSNNMLLAKCELALNVKSIYEQFYNKNKNQIQICVNGDVMLNLSKATTSLLIPNNEDRITIEPYETLIFFGSGNYHEVVREVVKSLPSECNPLLVEFVNRCSPFQSLFNLIANNSTLGVIGLTIEQALKFSKHLICHGKARAILPLSDHSEFVITDFGRRLMTDSTLRKNVAHDFYLFFRSEGSPSVSSFYSQGYSSFCSDCKIIAQLVSRLSKSNSNIPHSQQISPVLSQENLTKRCNVNTCSCNNDFAIIEIYMMFLISKISSANGPFKLSSLINIYEVLNKSLCGLDIIIWLLKTDLIAPLLTYPIISRFITPKPEFPCQEFSHLLTSIINQYPLKEPSLSMISKSTTNVIKTVDTSSESTVQTLSGNYSFQPIDFGSIKIYMDGHYCEDKILLQFNIHRSQLKLLYQKHNEIFIIKRPRPMF